MRVDGVIDPKELADFKKKSIADQNNKMRRQSMKIDSNISSNQVLNHISTDRILKSQDHNGQLKTNKFRYSEEDMLIENSNYENMMNDIEIEFHELAQHKHSMESQDVDLNDR